MKRILSVLLACSVLVLFAVPAYAVDYVKSPGEDPKIIIEGDESLMLVTTPVECYDDALHPAIQDMLARAWAQILAADDLTDLTPDVIPALEEIKAESDDPMVKALTIQDFVVCDVFDVSLIKNKTKLVHPDPGQITTFSVKTDLEPGDAFLILHNYDNTSWEVVDRWDLGSDGVMLIAVDSLSPFALAVPDYYNLTVDVDGPVSPQTGDGSADPGFLQTVVLACGALFLMGGAVYYRKRHLYR